MTVCSTGDDASQQQQLSYLQSCGFGGSWRFTGPLNVSRQNPNNVKLLLNQQLVILMQDSIRSPTDRGSQAFDLNASNR
ncbi:unnamed protein product [Rotaria socialis]|uniref:Uncharacterized protein n=1 Tax=Rotaria socialis TaxID=392032 RepID=A0A818NUY6_9BILA|nr:unnamed protein product [Rotaria socialis]CAF3610809.1 unnamed protein product [Rotaria socialis]CAF4383486.1 unnamed protein product [Rotaria socialis]CAF4391701.1 unnamed protein product [Rotaria socialis]